jgi:hypothetical protein
MEWVTTPESVPVAATPLTAPHWSRTTPKIWTDVVALNELSKRFAPMEVIHFSVSFVLQQILNLKNYLVPSDNLKIESVELFSRDNAREHRTDRYEMVFDNGRVTNDETFG